MCITRKGDPALRLLTNRGRENHLFALSALARDYSFGLKQITPSNTELGKLLGYYSNIQHEMLSRNAAQQRSGNRPAAPQAFQTLPRAQTPTNGCTTSQVRQRQLGSTTAAQRPAGTMDTSHVSRIHDGTPPPQPRTSTPHAIMPMLQRAAPTTTRRVQHERKAQPARPYPLKDGNEQAGSSLQLSGDSTPHAALAHWTLQPTQPSMKDKPSTQHMPTPARDLPFGAGHEQAKHAMGHMPANIKQNFFDDREML